MIVTVSNVITIDNFTPDILKWCEKTLTFKNPEYTKKLKMGLWLGKTPETIRLYEIHGNQLVIPFGMLRKLLLILPSDTTLLKGFKTPVNVPFGGVDIPLYDYQKTAVERMYRNKYGMLIAPCGSGKTQSGLAIVKMWQHPALWLTHTADLLNQAMTRAKQYIDPELIGTITEGKVNIGKGITFATVQTMSKIDLPRYKDEWDVIVTDECHRVAASPTGVAMFQKVLNNLSARHKYGLTATPHRADGMMNAAYAILGDIVHEVPPEAVGDKIVKVGIKAISTGTQLTPECLNEDGTKNFTRTMNYLAGNADRNRLIVEQIIAEREHSCLILSHRLSQLVNLRCMIPEKMRDKAAIIDGKSPKLKREQALEDMRNGTKQYLFATFSLAREGLDIPRLDRLFMALPVSDSAVTEQSIGRIARAFNGKDPPIAYDFVDDFRSAEYWYKSRLKVYRKIGAEFV